ncbi:LPXTG-motif cell wall anchor domain-containing protein [Butyrivibrio proteoclasticus]|uniref:LPXTG-motif cell wall anchor domain-containing protein n=1 Tax=Butyrivibrio proteoclasticus TaxID=43305 RepID=A0A1I5XLH3_9FIRM|nr:LPXTG cell wall anchor domain-containing protein [Butyrivibrio proteoclasticus]SFQ32666.1 LPXTG-motif cell wall anchor domain-containing protein [Butyrivibrio proteoclasticus]
MKGLKKLLTGILAATMIMGASITAFAQDVSVASGNASITISNAAKGETYAIHKLFSATVTGTEGGSIAYTGDIPDSLSDYFTKDAYGNISATEAAYKNETELSADAVKAIKEWAETDTAVYTVVSDGSTLKFNNLDYGYYVVETSQGDQAITVNSTNPNATLVDKNSSTPNLLEKKVDDDNVYIGQTVNYTVEFETSNYDGAGEGAKQIVSYTIVDTLPEFLKNVTVTDITVDEDGDAKTTNDQTKLAVTQFNDNKELTIPWVDGATSLYKNGAHVFVTYSAVVTEKAAVDGAGNKNTVALKWTTTDNNPHEDEDKKEVTIFTYAFAVKKVDQAGNDLAGATFMFPFYVQATPDVDGAYIYAGKTAGEGLVNELTTATGDTKATIIVKGLPTDEKVAITESVAPNGYNRLTEEIEVTPVKTGQTTTKASWKLDKDGNIVDGSYTESTTDVTYENELIAATAKLVVNKTGSILPSTGGIGTTLFYIFGGVLIIAGVAYFIVRRKADAE